MIVARSYSSSMVHFRRVAVDDVIDRDGHVSGASIIHLVLVYNEDSRWLVIAT